MEGNKSCDQFQNETDCDPHRGERKDQLEEAGKEPARKLPHFSQKTSEKWGARTLLLMLEEIPT